MTLYRLYLGHAKNFKFKFKDLNGIKIDFQTLGLKPQNRCPYIRVRVFELRILSCKALDHRERVSNKIDLLQTKFLRK